MADLSHPKTVTYEEWLNMPVSEGREEVVNGEIREIPPARSVHARIVHRLVYAFVRQLAEAEYDVLTRSFGLVIRKAPLTSRTPDLAIFERASVVEIDGYYHSAPKLAIEVLSPSESRRDTAEKVADYESIGVPEVWIVSPQARNSGSAAARTGTPLPVRRSRRRHFDSPRTPPRPGRYFPHLARLTAAIE